MIGSTSTLPGKLRFMAQRVWKRINSPARLLAASGKALRLVRSEGLGGLWRRVSFLDAAERDYRNWIAAYDTLAEADREAIRAHIRRLADPPLLSIVMPVYNTHERWLRLAIASVRAQLYERWELCIADDASTAPHVRSILAEAAAADPRIRVVYREVNGGIASASNSALGLATGGFVGLLDHDDELSEHALYHIAAALGQEPSLDFLYSDEDKLDERGRRCLPYFKPDWNPDLLLEQNYITHFAVYRRTLLTRSGGFRTGFEGSQDFDLILRAAELTSPERIRHLPFVLYHWRMAAGSTARVSANKGFAQDSARRAVEEALRRRGVNAKIELGLLPDFGHVAYSVPEPEPLVSLIVPTRDGYRLLKGCLEGIFGRTTYRNYEVIVLDNESTKPEMLAYFDVLRANPRVRVIPYPHPFNHSKLNNFGAAQARGEMLCLLNDDVDVISPGWLTEMVGQALRPEIGAVGARLLYPDGTLQHAGIVMGIGGSAGHFCKHLPAQHSTMGLRTFVAQSFSGVTAACLVLRRQVFLEVGGFDEELGLVFNDVDLCLRLRERGYRNLWTPFATLYHYESVTRGRDDRPDNAGPFRRNLARLRSRWGESLLTDPAYNPNLTLEREDCGLAFPPRVSPPWRARADLTASARGAEPGTADT